ncbi:DUF3592 domain-containing protein [Halocola ammonii]
MAPWLEIVVQILCVVALLLIIWWKAKPAIQFRMRAVETKGTIVNWMKTVSGGKSFFYPMIEFSDQEGKQIRFKAKERSEDKPMFDIGTAVTVKFDPKNPERRKVTYPKSR